MEDIEIAKTGDLEYNDIISSTDIYYKQWSEVLAKEYPDKTESKIKNIVRTQFFNRIYEFRDGQLSAYSRELNRVLGNISSLRVFSNTPMFEEDIFSDYNKLTGNGYFSTHRDNGNVGVCPAVNTDPELHKLGIKGVAKKLILAQRELFTSLKDSGIERMIVFTRPSGFKKYIDKCGVYSLDKYLEYKKNGSSREFVDAIDLHTNLGARIIRGVENSRPADESALGCNVIMEYEI